jgi:hypothetical protein
MAILLSRIEDKTTTIAEARAYLADDRKISSFIKTIRTNLDQSNEALAQKFQAEAHERARAEVIPFLERIDSNTLKSLSEQNNMRTEFKNMLGQLHTEITGMKAVNAELHASSKDIISHTKEILKTAYTIVEEVKKAVQNTSTRTAIFVGLGVGVATGLPISYFYERHLSKDALGQTKPQAIVLELKTDGAGNCLPSDTLQKLQSGQSVTLPTGSGTVCLILPQQQPQQPPPPRQEVPVAVQPLPAKPVVQTPKLPHHGTHHIRKLHGCHH